MGDFARQFKDETETNKQMSEMLLKRIIQIESDIKLINKALDNPKDVITPVLK